MIKDQLFDDEFKDNLTRLSKDQLSILYENWRKECEVRKHHRDKKMREMVDRLDKVTKKCCSDGSSDDDSS